MWTAHSGPSLFWPSKVCICFNSISMLTFNNIVRWHFYTHRVRLMLQMMPPSLSFVFFSSSHLSLTATAQLRNEWWVYSLFLMLWLPQRDFCCLFLLLWLSVGLSVGLSAKRDLLEKILENLNLKLRDLNPQSYSLFTIEKFFAGTRDWTRVCSLIMPLMHLL
jgi:hypothetical protein